jgi:hypothetical protein
VRRLGHRRKKWLEVGDDRWVPPVSEGEREEGCTGSGEVSGPRARFFVGPKGLPGVLFLFSFLFFFFFFCFLISFVSFAKMLQINSNQFQKFSKNQCNDLTLQEN